MQIFQSPDCQSYIELLEIQKYDEHELTTKPSNNVAIQEHIGIRYYEPVHKISNNVVCATSKGSDQPAHTRSLIKAFTSRLNIL